MSRLRFLVPSLFIFCVSSFSAHADFRTERISDYDWEFFAGNLQFTILHELGHAFLGESKIPVLGEEENAADKLAMMALLLSDTINQHTKGTKRLLAAADGWLLEWVLEQQSDFEIPYWDERPLKIQRFYKIVCMIYGSDPEAYATYNHRLRLPYERSWSCIDDYNRAKKNVNWMREINQLHVPNTSTHADSDGVGVVFETPTTHQRKLIADLLSASRIIEAAASTFTNLFPLQTNVSIVLTNGCDATAYWREDLNEIILCYALVEQFMYLAKFRHCVNYKANTTPRPRPPDNKSVNQCLTTVAQKASLPHWLIPSL